MLHVLISSIRRWGSRLIAAARTLCRRCNLPLLIWLRRRPSSSSLCTCYYDEAFRAYCECLRHGWPDDAMTVTRERLIENREHLMHQAETERSPFVHVVYDDDDDVIPARPALIVVVVGACHGPPRGFGGFNPLPFDAWDVLPSDWRACARSPPAEVALYSLPYVDTSSSSSLALWRETRAQQAAEDSSVAHDNVDANCPCVMDAANAELLRIVAKKKTTHGRGGGGEIMQHDVLAEESDDGDDDDDDDVPAFGARDVLGILSNGRLLEGILLSNGVATAELLQLPPLPPVCVHVGYGGDDYRLPLCVSRVSSPPEPLPPRVCDSEDDWARVA